MKRTSLFLLAAVVFLFYSSCTKDQVPGSGDIEFYVEVTQTEDCSARVTIRHNGTNRDHYMGFFVSGAISDIDAEVAGYVKAGGGKELYAQSLTQRKKVVEVGPLSSSQTYTYIAFGISEDGSVYGKPGSAVFATEKKVVTFIENQDWSLAYTGESFYENAYWSQVDFRTADGSDERCLVWFLSEEDCSAGTSASYIIYTAKESYEEYYKSHNTDYNESDMWADNEWIVHRSTNYYIKRTPGNYLAVAIGINSDGAFTGHYKISETFKVEEYTPNATYTQYYGNWTLTDSSGQSYDVNISKRVVNSSLLLTGVGVKGVSRDLNPIVMTIEENTGIFKLSKQKVSSGISAKDSDGNSFTADAYLFGWYSTDKETVKRALTSNVAVGCMNSVGQVDIVSGFYISDDDDVQYGMYFELYKEDGSRSGYYLNDSKLVFPIKLVRR